MTRSCKSCIHRQVCEIYDVTNEPLEAIGCVHFLDTADVVPKSEVAREIFEEIESILCISEGKYTNMSLKDAIAILKKKYTEESK